MSRLVRALIGVAAGVAWSVAAMAADPAEGEPVVAEWQTFIQAVAEGTGKPKPPAGTDNVVTTLTKFPDAPRDQLLDWLRQKMTREVLADKFDRVGRYQAFERCLATGSECDELRKLAAHGNWDSAGEAAGTQPPAGATPPSAATPTPPAEGGTPPVATQPPATPPSGTTPTPVQEPRPPERPDPTLPVLDPNETACCRFTNPFTGGPSCSATQDPRDCRDRLRGEIMLKHSCVKTETCVPD